MAKGKTPKMDYSEHERTYGLFLQLAIAVVLSCVLVLVALVGMTVIGGAAFWWGLLGLIVGHAVIGATLIAGLSWTASIVTVVVTALLCVASL